MLLGVLLPMLIIAPVSESHVSRPEGIAWNSYTRSTFDKALIEDKPIFLMITTDWCLTCRFYEDEVITHPNIVGLLGDRFISVYVKGDERPDIFNEYVVEIEENASSGYPKTVLLTPHGEMLNTYSGVIYPEYLYDNLHLVLDYLEWGMINPPTQQWIDDEGIVLAKSQAYSSTAGNYMAPFTLFYDLDYGGFDWGSKFPATDELSALIDGYYAFGNGTYLDMVNVTLYNMTYHRTFPEPGENYTGLYDPIDGGFFHFASSREWGDQSSEKLPQINAAIINLLAKAYEATGNSSYVEVADTSMDYLLRVHYDDLNGGFYGGLETDPVYYSTPDRTSLEFPYLDTVKYTDWNGEVVVNLLQASEVFGRTDVADVALATLDFMAEELVTDRGMLHFYDPDKNAAYLDGQLLDNAWAIYAFLEGYEYSGDEKYLNLATQIIDAALEHLYDTANGGFFQRSSSSTYMYNFNQESLSIKRLEPNGMMCFNLLKAWEHSGNDDYNRRAQEIFGKFVLDPMSSLSRIWYSFAAKILASHDNPPVLVKETLVPQQNGTYLLSVEYFDPEQVPPTDFSVIIDGVSLDMTPGDRNDLKYWKYQIYLDLSEGSYQYYYSGSGYTTDRRDTLVLGTPIIPDAPDDSMSLSLIITISIVAVLAGVGLVILVMYVKAGKKATLALEKHQQKQKKSNRNKRSGKRK